MSGGIEGSDAVAGFLGPTCRSRGHCAPRQSRLRRKSGSSYVPTHRFVNYCCTLVISTISAFSRRLLSLLDLGEIVGVSIPHACPPVIRHIRRLYREFLLNPQSSVNVYRDRGAGENFPVPVNGKIYITEMSTDVLFYQLYHRIERGITSRRRSAADAQYLLRPYSGHRDAYLP